MTIDELIELAENARQDLGGHAQVRIAYQPGYPLRAALPLRDRASQHRPVRPVQPGRDSSRTAERQHVPMAGHRRPPRPREPLRPRMGWSGSLFMSEEDR